MNEVARPREQVGGVFALETIDKTNEKQGNGKKTEHWQQNVC